MSKIKILISLFILFTICLINASSRVIVLPIYYSSSNEPNQFTVDSIIDFYSKNGIYTSIKMGSPPVYLEILLDDEDSGFYIKEGNCVSGSEYKIRQSSTFCSGQGFIYQYINNELTALLNNTNDKILLNQASQEYFYSSLKDRRFGSNLTTIEVSNFSFLYIPNSGEIKRIEEQIAENKKKEKEKDKKDNNKKKNDDKNDNKKDDEKNNKGKKDKKDKKKDGYGEDYYPDYYDFYGDDDEDDIQKNGFGPYNPKGGDDEDDITPWNDMYSYDNKKCAHLGLLPPGAGTGLTNLKLNFIQQLKNKKIIDNYNWYIRFNKDKTGELVIGAAPHEVKPENYLESDLSMTHAKLVNDVFFWQIKFTAIYMKDNISNKRYNLEPVDGLITINENFIYSTSEFFNNIKTIYFEQYFNNRKCRIETVVKTHDRYSVIFCHQKNFTTEDMEQFPVLSFQSSDLNFVFNFDHNDLFLKTRDKYIFKIIYSRDFNHWKLGKVFLEKYQFVFNYDSKMFGFYQKYIPENIEGDKIIDFDVTKNKKEKGNDKLPPSNRKKMRENNKILNEEKEKDYIKIIIIVFLIVLVILLGIYMMRRCIFNKQVNSKNIENYGKYKPNKSKSNKNKILRLTEEFNDGENI